MSRQDASRVTDLVCRMRIRPDDVATTEEYEGLTFYFCSLACHEEFVADRTFYAKIAEVGPVAHG